MLLSAVSRSLSCTFATTSMRLTADAMAASLGGPGTRYRTARIAPAMVARIPDPRLKRTEASKIAGMNSAEPDRIAGAHPATAW